MLKMLQKQLAPKVLVGLVLSVLYWALFFLNSWHQGLAWFRPAYIIETLNMPPGLHSSCRINRNNRSSIIVGHNLLSCLPDNRWF